MMALSSATVAEGSAVVADEATVEASISAFVGDDGAAVADGCATHLGGCAVRDRASAVVVDDGLPRLHDGAFEASVCATDGACTAPTSPRTRAIGRTSAVD